MLALVAFGIVTAATRRATLFQVIGIVLVENGLALAALQLPGGASFAIELGVALDLMLVAVVAGGLPRADLRRVRRRRHARLRACVTSRERSPGGGRPAGASAIARRAVAAARSSPTALSPARAGAPAVAAALTLVALRAPDDPSSATGSSSTPPGRCSSA